MVECVNAPAPVTNGAIPPCHAHAIVLLPRPAMSTILNTLSCHAQAAGASARATLVNCADHLGARRVLEKLMGAQERDELLGPLPSVPPDYMYSVQVPPTSSIGVVSITGVGAT